MKDEISEFAKLAKKMLPLAKKLASDEFTAEDRARLRELAGTSTIFELKNELVKLCGERARAQLLNQEYHPPNP
jgi:hypothetical protein